MLVRVTCAGVVVGTAQLDPRHGLAHSLLSPTDGYEIASPAARSLGRRLAVTRFWSPGDGDFAAALAAQWRGGRLGLEDTSGREIGVDSVVVIEAPAGAVNGSAVCVVADFRSDVARARLHLPPASVGGGTSARGAA